MRVDVCSDLHWDLWISDNQPAYAQEKKLEQLITQIVPEEHSDYLVIAGDIGHNNNQNLMAFEILMKRYKKVFWEAGNHDLYLLSKTQLSKYRYNSFNRLQEMIEKSEKISGVHYLGGRVFEVDGKKITGTSMWYDFQFGIQKFNLTIQQIEDMWRDYSNDSRKILVNARSLNNLEYFKSQKDKLKSSISEADLIVTHIGPDWSNIKPRFADDPTSAFYYFDGSDLLEKCAGKTWLFGHTHDIYFYEYKGCRLITYPLGYAEENGIRWNDMSQIGNLYYKFKTIEV